MKPFGPAGSRHDARLGELTGRGAAQWRNEPGGGTRLYGTFEGEGANLKALAEACRPVRFEGVTLDHAKRYKTVATVRLYYYDGRSTVLFKGEGELELYSLLESASSPER